MSRAVIDSETGVMYRILENGNLTTIEISVEGTLTSAALVFKQAGILLEQPEHLGRTVIAYNFDYDFENDEQRLLLVLE